MEGKHVVQKIIGLDLSLFSVLRICSGYVFVTDMDSWMSHGHADGLTANSN